MRRSNLEVYFSCAEALSLIDIGPSNALDERLSCAPPTRPSMQAA